MRECGDGWRQNILSHYYTKRIGLFQFLSTQKFGRWAWLFARVVSFNDISIVVWSFCYLINRNTICRLFSHLDLVYLDGDNRGEGEDYQKYVWYRIINGLSTGILSQFDYVASYGRMPAGRGRGKCWWRHLVGFRGDRDERESDG